MTAIFVKNNHIL